MASPKLERVRLPSRAFDPTYKPTKTWAQLAAEIPGNPGLWMLADRERALSLPRP